MTGQQPPKFDSYVMLPNGQLVQSTAQGALPVVLIKPMMATATSSSIGEEQQYSTVLYGDLIPSNNSTKTTTDEPSSSPLPHTLITLLNSNSGSDTSSDTN
jgi:hypothetical protein